MKPLARRRKLRIKLVAFAGIESLSIERRTVLFRVAQEALTNIARHARATKVNVSIQVIPNGVRMEIHDDGISFKVPERFAARASQRLGLIGMRERMEMMGGSLQIQSAPGSGTTVHADLPLARPSSS